MISSSPTWLGWELEEISLPSSIREASDYLSAALELTSDSGSNEPPSDLLQDLARARQRLGEFDSAVDSRAALAETVRQMDTVEA